MSDLKYYFTSVWIDPSNGDTPNIVELFVVTDEPSIRFSDIKERIKTQYFKPKRISIVNIQEIDEVMYAINVERPNRPGLKLFINEENFKLVDR